MKNLLIMAVLAILAAACVKQINPAETDDSWNGYQKYLKMGEQVHTLWAGKHINAGTVTYCSDGVLYAIAPISNNSVYNFIYSIDTECGILTAIEDEIINIDDPFSDLSGGPSM